MKFGLGTANFSHNYGLLKKKANTQEIFKFLNKEKSITLIDTAPAYANSEKLIGKYLKKKIKIITKINPLQFSSAEKNLDKFKREFDNSLHNLKINSIYGVLFHRDVDVYKKNHDKFFYYLEDLVKLKLVRKIGLSTYNTKDIADFFKIFKFKIIQMPINIFNIHDNYINNLYKLKKDYNFELHARSIFLQGLGFLNEINHKHFYKLNKKLNLLSQISRETKISKFEIMLYGVRKLKIADNYILGFRSYNDMLHLKNFSQKRIKFSYKKFLINDKLILDPRKWPKKI